MSLVESSKSDVLPITSSPYLSPHEASQYRKNYKGLSTHHKTLLELHDFYTRPAKHGYAIIDDLLSYAYHPDNTDECIGECDFYNMPSKKGYVLGYNGILYTARLDKMNGDGIVEEMPRGFKGYFLTANVNQHKMIEGIWKKIIG